MIVGLRKAIRVMGMPLQRTLNRAVDARLQLRGGMVPINYTEPQDIFIAGYPKSGNTWMQNLIAGLMFAMDMRFAPDRLVQNLVPDVHYQQYYRRYLSFVAFKTHFLPRPEYRRVIHLVRDGRDAMVSYFHYLAAMNSPMGFHDLVAAKKGVFPCAWHEHVEAWTRNPWNAEVLMVRYEDLMRDTTAELVRICAFAELRRDAAILDMVARTCAFEVMQRKEREQGWDNEAWPKDKAFARRGQVGSYKDEMPPDVLDAFMSRSDAALKSVGYAKN